MEYLDIFISAFNKHLELIVSVSAVLISILSYLNSRSAIKIQQNNDDFDLKHKVIDICNEIRLVNENSLILLTEKYSTLSVLRKMDKKLDGNTLKNINTAINNINIQIENVNKYIEENDTFLDSIMNQSSESFDSSGFTKILEFKKSLLSSYKSRFYSYQTTYKVLDDI